MLLSYDAETIGSSSNETLFAASDNSDGVNITDFSCADIFLT